MYVLGSFYSNISPNDFFIFREIFSDIYYAISFYPALSNPNLSLRIPWFPFNHLYQWIISFLPLKSHPPYALDDFWPLQVSQMEHT